MLKKALNYSSYPLTVYLLWRAAVLGYQIFLQPYYKVTIDSLTVYQRIYLSWTTYWDLGHYIGIALNGYHYPQQAFFPLWPLVIKLFSSSGVSVYLVVYILVFILGLSTFILFYNLAINLVGKGHAKRALIIFCMFPSTMFLMAGYSEALFLSLALLSFLLLERRYYFLSAVISSLATSTRLVGVALTAALLTAKKLSFIQLGSLFLVAISGLLVYMAYLQLDFNDPLLFTKATKEWCQISGKCGLTFPLSPLISYGRLLLLGWVKPNLSYVFLDWLASVGFLLLLFKVFKKLHLNYLIYSLIVVLLPLSTGSTVGMVRYVLAAFPVFFILPSLIKSKALFILVCLTLFLLQLRFIALFTSRIWVA